MTVLGAPWKFSPSHIEEGPSAVRAADGWIVCTTSSDEHARLIAEAPDLLKYLEIAVGVIGASRMVWMGCDEALAVIARAKGGA